MKKIVILIALILSGCSNLGTSKEYNIKANEIGLFNGFRNGKYVNRFFNFKCELPTDSYIVGKFEKDYIFDYSKYLMEEEEFKPKDKVKEEFEEFDYLFWVLRKNPEEVGEFEFNSSLTCIVEDLREYRYFREGRHYLYYLRHNIKSEYPGAQVSRIDEFNNNGAEFATINFEYYKDNGFVTDEYYVTMRKGFALIFKLNCDSKEDLAYFDDVINSIEFIGEMKSSEEIEKLKNKILEKRKEMEETERLKRKKEKERNDKKDEGIII